MTITAKVDGKNLRYVGWTEDKTKAEIEKAEKRDELDPWDRKSEEPNDEYDPVAHSLNSPQ